MTTVTAVDKSTGALAVAMLNARELGVANVEFAEGDWVEPVADRTFDLIVSNPPYVGSEDAELAALHYEPRLALVAGTDGLDAIRVLVRDCAQILVDDGMLIFEHGATQEAAVSALLGEHGWREIQCHRDYAGLPRVTQARCPMR